MTDPYQVLGLTPEADEAAIRGAYRALMKRYHPDQNRSEDAADKARDVAAAYALLTDPARRARYNRERHFRENLLTSAPPPSRAAARARGRAGGVLLVLLSAGIVAFALNRATPPSVPSAPPSPRPAAIEPQPAAPPELASPVTPPAPVPVVTAPPPALTGAVPAPLPDLPPAATPIPLPMAAPVRTLPSALPTKSASRVRLASKAAPPPPIAVASSAPAPTRPVPDCDKDPTCTQIDLAALDRLQTTFYNQSYLAATAPKQALLLSSRASFLARLGRCTSAACKRDAYLARNREIATIMRG